MRSVLLMTPTEEHRIAPGPKVAVMTSNPELLAQVLDALGRAELASTVIMGPPADERTRIPELCDVILVDLDVEGAFPADVVESVRSRTGAILIALSSRDDETAKVAALNAGANDYISTPFGTSEFLARVQAARRVHRQLRPATTLSLLDEHGDPDERTLTIGGRKIFLTRIEWRLFSILAARAGRVVPHSELLREIWGPLAERRVHYLRVYMNKLRRKIEPDPDRPKYLLSVPKSGYLFQDPDPGD